MLTAGDIDLERAELGAVVPAVDHVYAICRADAAHAAREVQQAVHAAPADEARDLPSAAWEGRHRGWSAVLQV